MSLLKRLFGEKPPAAAATSFQDSDTSAYAPSSRSAPRREAVHVVLRETMRRHGIPSDWIECRTLNLVQPDAPAGTYVMLIVKRGQDRLLAYVPAFQASLREALTRFDPRAAEWLLGLAWQFEEDPAATAPRPVATNTPAAGRAAAQASSGLAFAPAAGLVPPAAGAAAACTRSGEAGAQPPASPEHEDELQADLRALFAIRDAALAGQVAPADAFKPTEHGGL